MTCRNHRTRASFPPTTWVSADEATTPGQAHKWGAFLFLAVMVGFCAIAVATIAGVVWIYGAISLMR